MAISIDHDTKIITVNQADCTLVSGTFYRLPTKTVFKAAVDALMDNEDYIFMPDPISHNTDYTVAGITYAPKIEVINGYSVQFLPNTAWSCELTESNNNLWDVGNGILVQNAVQVIPTNSAGYVLVSTGSGLSAEQDTRLTRVHSLLDVIEGAMDHQEVMRILLAAVAGKASGMDTLTPTFRDMGDNKNRITAVTDADGNRMSVTLDGS